MAVKAVINIGGKEYTVRPLTLAQVRRFHESGTLEKVPQKGVGLIVGIEMQNATVEVLLASLTRSHPELTREALEDMIDLGDIEPVLQTVFGVSGITPAEEKKGEAQSGQ